VGGVTHPKGQAVHRWQGLALLRDPEEEERGFDLRPCPGGAAAELPLTALPLLRQVRGILVLIGHLQGRQQLLKLVQREPCGGQKCPWCVF